jgi:hypothetical protein
MQEEKNMDNTQEQKIESQTATESISQEDIFAQVFGQSNEEEFVARVPSSPETNEQSETSDVQSDVEPKGDPSSYQYWQSQADKRAAEVELLKSQVTELMKARTSTPAEPAKEETVKLERPVKPRKPADYDHSEALADPESESGKYLARQEQYMDSLTNYMESMESKRENELRQRMAEQETFSKNQRIMSDLQSKYSYTPQEASDFIEQMSKPDSLSLDNLVKLHRMGRQTTQQAPQVINQITPEAQQKQFIMNQRQEKLSIPKPIGVQPGANVQSSKSVEDQMMDSMIGNFKKKNPF